MAARQAEEMSKEALKEKALANEAAKAARNQIPPLSRFDAKENKIEQRSICETSLKQRGKIHLK